MRQIRKYQKDKGRILDSNKLLYHSLPIGCILALLLLGSICINPLGFGIGISNGRNDSLSSIGNSNKAYAAELTSSTNDTSAALIVDDGNIEDVILAESGVNYKSHNIKIKAANVESYTLQISASSNGTSELKLDGGNTTIPGAGGVVGSNMPTNTWGYAWGAENATEDSMTYYTLPAYGNVGTTISTGLLASDTPTNNTIDTSNKLSFAANFSDSIPSGHYTTSVLLSLAVEPKAVVAQLPVSFASYTTMQEITKAKCDSSSIPIGTEGRLRDTRDDKWYWVAKLRDGLCWMTQDLDYNGGGTNVVEPKFPNDTTARYYDPGDNLVNIDGTSSNYTKLDDTMTMTDNSDFIDTTTYSSIDGKTTCTKGAGSMFGDLASEYMSCRVYHLRGTHYLVGNYYNYNAATNGTGESVSNGDALSSICPIGWSLPTSKNSNAGSFDALTSVAEASNILIAAPYYFAYNGNIYIDTLNSIGTSGYYWSSSTPNNFIYAYSLNFDSSGINASYSSVRYNGFPIRCVAR